MTRFPAVAACGVAALLTVPLGPWAMAQVDPRPFNPSGTWKRNAELSQEPSSKAAAALPDKPREYDPEDQRFRDLLFHTAKSLDMLTIEVGADDVKIITGEDAARIFYPGRQHVRQGLLGAKIQALARWEKSTLVIEEDGDDFRLTERVSMTPEGRLSYVLSLTHKRLKTPLTLSTLYDRAR